MGLRKFIYHYTQKSVGSKVPRFIFQISPRNLILQQKKKKIRQLNMTPEENTMCLDDVIK